MKPKELLIGVAAITGIVELSRFSFSQSTKWEAWVNAGEHCEMCGRRITNPQGLHHRVPEKALVKQGIKGTNSVENAACLCNSGRDCHEIADQKAIHQRLFWNGEAFVPLEAMPPETYRITKRRKK